MKTIIIGLGNPILRDDSVGPRAVRLIKERLGREMPEGIGTDVKPDFKADDGADVKVSEIYAGGIRLLDEMSGYDRAFIIDSIVTGETPGTIYRLTADDLPQSRNSGSIHDMTLPMALGMGRMLGMRLPEEILIWAIEAKDVDSFGEELSEEVEKSLPLVVNSVLGSLS
ncbi:MAG: hydrogenase maturation protease [Nitrospirae bacterium]|nr:hydrogenase maturation protease [Nitrospirota bacterium]